MTGDPSWNTFLKEVSGLLLSVEAPSRDEEYISLLYFTYSYLFLPLLMRFPFQVPRPTKWPISLSNIYLRHW